MSADCSGTPASVAQTTSCHLVSPGFNSFKSAAVFQVECAESGGAITSQPAPEWQSVVVACAMNGGPQPPSCGADHCAPALDPSFHYCIQHEGDLACPSAFLDRHVATTDAASFADTRGCTPCACGEQTMGICDVKTDLFSQGCTTFLTTVQNDGACAGASGVTGWKLHNTSSASGGTCKTLPGSGEPTGEVTPTGPMTTFCCL
jgi:hypothetical protein